MSPTTEKSFTKGTDFPALKEDTLRIYSMRFCPYAERTRLVLEHKDVAFETVNVDLKNKPDWFLSRTPAGTVPVLQFNDKFVYESAICDDFLDELYPKAALYPRDPYEKARQRFLMEIYSKVTTAFYKYMRLDLNSATQDEVVKIIDELHAALRPYEEAKKDPFFGGSQPSMLDLHIWPWFERLPALQNIKGATVLPQEKFPSLSAWVGAMHTVPAVKKCSFDTDKHVKFIKSALAGGTPDYDMDL